MAAVVETVVEAAADVIVGEAGETLPLTQTRSGRRVALIVV